MRPVACIVAKAVLALLLPVTAVAGERPAELVRLPEPVGVGRLVSPAADGPLPLVIVLPDALGEDGRSESYVDSLLARGVATLVLGLGQDLEPDPAAVDPAASPAAVALALAWAKDAGFAPSRTGLLGFGLGGRAVMAADPGTPAAALYPGCVGLPVPVHAPALVLQGESRAQGCAGLAEHAGLSVGILRGAGHAWDAPGAIWPSPGPALPDPAGSGPIRAEVSLAVTLMAAEAIADWFADLLLTPQRSAAR